MAEMDIIGFFRSMTGLQVAIRGIGYGLVLASIVAFFISLTNRRTVKRLLDAEAHTRDSAKSAAEIGAAGIGKLALRDKSTLRKTVKATELTDGAESGGVRYYIPEEDADAAEIRYVKKNPPVAWIVGTVLLVAVTEGAVIAVPWILSLFK